MKQIVAINCKEGNHGNTFAAKRDCRRIYRSLPNRDYSRNDSCLFLAIIRDANLCSLFENVQGT